MADAGQKPVDVLGRYIRYYLHGFCKSAAGLTDLLVGDLGDNLPTLT